MEGVEIFGVEEKASGDGAERAVEDRLEGTVEDRLERDVFGIGFGVGICFFGSRFSGLEFAVDGYEDILIEAGIGFESRFRFLFAFEHSEIVLEEADTPFRSFG